MWCCCNESQVAIKIVSKETIADVDDIERVYRETFILKTLKHQNIIKIFEVIDTTKAIMLVMEYADGGELFDYIASRGRLPELVHILLYSQFQSLFQCSHFRFVCSFLFALNETGSIACVSTNCRRRRLLSSQENHSSRSQTRECADEHGQNHQNC